MEIRIPERHGKRNHGFIVLLVDEKKSMNRATAIHIGKLKITTLMRVLRITKISVKSHKCA